MPSTHMRLRRSGPSRSATSQSRATTTPMARRSSTPTDAALRSDGYASPRAKTAKNRVHIDIRVAGEPPWNWVERATLIHAKVDELVTAGATKVREEEYVDDAGGKVLGHVVMLDPEGNEFCVA